MYLMIDCILLHWDKIMSILIAIFVAYIGYQQYKINHYKIQLDLYEKRYKIVQGYKNAIANLLRNGNLTEEELREFLITTKEAVYLFDDDISKHLDEVYEKFVNMQLYKSQLKENRELEQSLRREYANNSADTLKYFNRLLKESDKKYFKKYLDFTKLS